MPRLVRIEVLYSGFNGTSLVTGCLLETAHYCEQIKKPGVIPVGRDIPWPATLQIRP